METPKFLFNKTNRRTNFSKFIFVKKLYMFRQFLCPSSGVFHCTFGTGICHASMLTASSTSRMDDGQRTRPNNVEFLDKNKLGEIIASIGFVKKKLVTMHGHMNVKYTKKHLLSARPYGVTSYKKVVLTFIASRSPMRMSYTTPDGRFYVRVNLTCIGFWLTILRCCRLIC